MTYDAKQFDAKPGCERGWDWGFHYLHVPYYIYVMRRAHLVMGTLTHRLRALLCTVCARPYYAHMYI